MDNEFPLGAALVEQVSAMRVLRMNAADHDALPEIEIGAGHDLANRLRLRLKREELAAGAVRGGAGGKEQKDVEGESHPVAVIVQQIVHSAQ